LRQFEEGLFAAIFTEKYRLLRESGGGDVTGRFTKGNEVNKADFKKGLTGGNCAKRESRAVWKFRKYLAQSRRGAEKIRSGLDKRV
jgi:hypothetical protein